MPSAGQRHRQSGCGHRRDIGDVTASNNYGATATDFEANLDAYGAEKRYRRLLAECMYGRGYALSSEG